VTIASSTSIEGSMTMSRYIDADTVYETLCHLWDRSDSEEFEKEVFNTILSAPSIDIVRCKDCVYCNVQNTKYLYAICERHGIAFKPFEDDTRTHGCAWGKQTERSE
jgi:hypothetical protein